MNNDAANQLLSESITIAGLTGAKTVAYTYDVDGNRATLTDPSGSVLTYSYTDRNQIASIVADGPPPLATFTYDLAGNRTERSLENGIESTYAYDDDGRLTSLSHGSSVEALTYTYDAMNRRTGEIRSSGPARTFGYDLTGQLTSVNQSSGNATFDYDAVGNRTTVTGAPGAGSYTANNLNQYTTAGGVGSLTYDANGNLATGGGWTYTHNGNSRLAAASGPGSVSASFGRDGRNRDVKRTINGATTYLIYDGWNLVAEYDGSGVLAAQYIHGPQVDEILAKVTSASTTYPLADALGSTIAVTDGSGAVLERVFYHDAFGTPSFEDASGTPLTGTSTGTRFLFTGREWMPALNLYDYRNRTYSAELGRFIEADPIRFNAGDGNLYRYVSNNPVNLSDPEGLKKEDCCPEDKKKVQKEKDKIKAAAKSWNKTSPGWSPSNQCGQQAGNLAVHISRSVNPIHWMPSSIGGSGGKIFGITFNHHQAVQIKALPLAEKCNFKSFILDGYKDLLGIRNGEVEELTPDQFDEKYPYPHPNNYRRPGNW